MNNEIIIGSKPFLKYIKSIEILFKRNEIITLKARGMNIKTAVDLAEAAKNRFLEELNISIKNIKTSTSTFKDQNDVNRFVSSIEIELSKSQGL